MDAQKRRNYLGLLFVIPILLIFLISEYRSRTFTYDPEETKVHKWIEDILQALLGGGRWHTSYSGEALFGWWLLLCCCVYVVWRNRAKLGGLVVQGAAAFHRKV